MNIKEIIISLIIGSIIGGIWVQYSFSGNIWSNKPREDLCSYVIEKQKIEESKETEYCYFQSTYGDVVKEVKLNCDRFIGSNFDTIHWNSLPHGFVK